MRKTKTLEVPNAILILVGDRNSVIPELQGDRVVSSGTAVLIVTLHGIEGPTTFALSDEAPKELKLDLAFDGIVEFRGGLARLMSVNGDELWLLINQPMQRVRVFKNLPQHADVIEICVTPAM